MSYELSDGVSCQLVALAHAGRHYLSDEWKEAADRCNWNGLWPVIDSAGLLTGEVTEGRDNESNVDDEAMIRTADAAAAGWQVEYDGYATPPDVVIDAGVVWIVYWWRRKRWPLNSIDDVLVVKDDEWDSEHLGEKPMCEDASDTAWHRVAMPAYSLEDDGYITSELGLDGQLRNTRLIMDALIIRAALIIEARITPSRPEDPVYDCPWQPRDIDDGGSSDEPSDSYAELQAFCRFMYEEMSQRLSERGVDAPQLVDIGERNVMAAVVANLREEIDG